MFPENSRDFGYLGVGGIETFEQRDALIIIPVDGVEFIFVENRDISFREISVSFRYVQFHTFLCFCEFCKPNFI